MKPDRQNCFGRKNINDIGMACIPVFDPVVSENVYPIFTRFGRGFNSVRQRGRAAARLPI